MKTKFRTILVPHDLSKHADRALKVAAGMVPAPERLIVLHVAGERHTVTHYLPHAPVPPVHETREREKVGVNRVELHRRRHHQVD
jgi:hypothetical protein